MLALPENNDFTIINLIHENRGDSRVFITPKIC